jgi:hypothetical protein
MTFSVCYDVEKKIVFYSFLGINDLFRPIVVKFGV